VGTAFQFIAAGSAAKVRPAERLAMLIAINANLNTFIILPFWAAIVVFDG
jgi:hypothetical protein